MNIPYRIQRMLKRLVVLAAIALVVLALLALCWFLWLDRYVVYTRNGAMLDFERTSEDIWKTYSLPWWKTAGRILQGGPMSWGLSLKPIPPKMVCISRLRPPCGRTLFPRKITMTYWPPSLTGISLYHTARRNRLPVILL